MGWVHFSRMIHFHDTGYQWQEDVLGPSGDICCSLSLLDVPHCYDWTCSCSLNTMPFKSGQKRDWDQSWPFWTLPPKARLCWREPLLGGVRWHSGLQNKRFFWVQQEMFRKHQLCSLDFQFFTKSVPAETPGWHQFCILRLRCLGLPLQIHRWTQIRTVKAESLPVFLHTLKTTFDHPTPHLDNVYVQNICFSRWLRSKKVCNYFFCLQNVRIVHLCWGLKQASTTEEPPVWQDQERSAEVGRMLVAWSMLEITTTAEIQTHSGKAWVATQMMVSMNLVKFRHALLIFNVNVWS